MASFGRRTVELYDPRVVRVAVFAVTGILWCASSILSSTNPNFQHPVSVVDWAAVLCFSGALFALASALPSLARLVGRPRIFRVSLVPAAGAALAGLSNLLEDGMQLEWAFWPFVAGAAIVIVGLVALASVVAATVRGKRRLLAAVPGAQLICVPLLREPLVGALILTVWLFTALLALRLRSRVDAAALPTPP